MRDLEQVGQIIEELVRRANADPRDYRPWGGRFDHPRKRRTKPVKKKFIKPGKDFKPLEGQQMSLFEQTEISQKCDMPLSDIFPEAYQ